MSNALGPQGLDSFVARVLHKRGRFDVPTLQRYLAEVQRIGHGATLGGLLIKQGLLQPGEVEAVLQEARNAAGTALTAPTPVMTRAQHTAGPAAAQAPTETPRAMPTVQDATETFTPAPAGPVLQPGSQVGSLTVVRHIGSGGMGEVYLGKDASGGHYAVKTLPKNATAEDLLRFQREGESQVGVPDHPNLVRVHRFERTTDGRPCLLLDYVSGGDLAERLKLGPLPPEEAAEIVIQLALGLGHLHDHGVLHRDVKPANVLFSKDSTLR